MTAINNADEGLFVKVTKEQALRNRQALLDAAGGLFKQHGIDGVGVADVCRQAGLTHGALYKHFADKQDLAAQAFSHSFRAGYDRVTAGRAGPGRGLDTYLSSYLSRRVRDDPAAGCPLTASACETGRQGEAVSRSFAAGFEELRDGIATTLPDAAPGRDALATTMVAALIGAMALSRGVLKADPALADQVLAQVRGVLEQLGDSGGASGPIAAAAPGP